jgi:CO/xanthine dehydrogenase Mo-binding subunit
MAVGTTVPRRDGNEKVTGEARYVDDIALPGMWLGATVRSPHPHARIRHIEYDPEYDWTGIVHVDASDIAPLSGGRGRNLVALIQEDQPALAAAEVLHATEPVALLACADPARLADALRHVHVDYEVLRPILTLAEAIDAGDATVIGRLAIRRGDLARGLAAADHVVDGTYRMGHQEQLYIEPQGVLAIPREDGGIRIIGSLQCPYYVHKALKALLGLDDSKVSVAQTVTGGGFGGKEEYPSILSAHAALLALKAGRPVKMVYRRAEDMQATTKRHPAIVRHETGVRWDGTLTAARIHIEIDAGAYVTLTPVVLSRAILHALGPYRCDNVELTACARRTHTPPNGAFRGFGAPQVTFPYERHLDVVAETVGISPLAMRRHNLVRAGDVLPTGQVLRYSVAAERVLDTAVASADYESRWKAALAGRAPVATPPGRRYGIGLSLFLHGAGFTGNGEVYLKSEAALELLRGGRVRVLSGSTDIGQGTRTIFPQIVAQQLGIPDDRVDVAEPDTAIVPDSGPTVASRTCMIVGKILQEAARQLADALCAFAATQKGAEGGDVRLEHGRFVGSAGGRGATFAEIGDAFLDAHGALRTSWVYRHPPEVVFDDKAYSGDAYAAYGWGADVAEVLVDEDTGEVAVLRMHTATDIGKAIHPVLCAGQIEGGALQGIGYGLCEEVVMVNGVMANSRFTNYIIPTSLDAPEFVTHLVEEPYFHGPFGAKGVGELPLDGAPPAVVAAVENALGLPAGTLDELPVTPERVLRAIEGRTRPRPRRSASARATPRAGGAT